MWVIVDSTKVYLTGSNTWYGFKADNYISYDTCRFGIDLKFAPIFSSPSGSMTANSNNSGGYNITDNYLTRDSGSYITITWSDFEWGLYDTRNSSSYWNSKNNADMNSGMTNIFDRLGEIYSTVNSNHIALLEKLQILHNSLITNIGTIIENVRAVRTEMLTYYRGMLSNLSTWFTTLFEKMDEDQEELINGYDPGTGSAAKNEFDSSAAELEAAEGDLFGQTSYDQVDYTQFNSFFSIEAVAASMLFVKSILESLYGALGVFGVPITIGLVLLVFTRIIGFQNFYSGGD